MRRISLFFFCCLIMACTAWAWKSESTPTLSKQEADRLGLQIWQNECAGKKEGLTSWNKGEEFASLGIGHFIWYPQGKSGHFKETFPQLVLFMESNGVVVPKGIKNSKGCPWPNRLDFEKAQQTPLMKELREWLYTHIDLQVHFIVNRLHYALPTMIKGLSSKKQSKITHQFYRLANSPGGLYVLIDYLNFKGEGVTVSESYQGHGWGLRQVLDRMKGTKPGPEAVQEFVNAAKYVLDERIENAPPERKEGRWRQGWFNRLDTYYP